MCTCVYIYKCVCVDVGMEYRYTPIQIICTTKILYIYDMHTSYY